MFKLVNIVAIIFIVGCSQTITDEAKSRSIARDIFENSSSSFDVDSLTQVYAAGGYSFEESRQYAHQVIEIMKTEEFLKKIEDIYIKHFTSDELSQISTMLGQPAFEKFLNLRPAISQDMMTALNEISSNKQN